MTNFPQFPVFGPKGGIIPVNAEAATWKGELSEDMDRDNGKKVIINSVGGTLMNAPGVVAKGPYKIVFIAKSKRNLNRQKKSMDTKITTEPYWLVRMDSNGFYLNFSEKEITFAQSKYNKKPSAIWPRVIILTAILNRHQMTKLAIESLA